MDAKYKEIKRLSKKLTKLADAGLVNAEGFEDVLELYEFMVAVQECAAGLNILSVNALNEILNGRFEKTGAYA